jgi:hypothetical protein
MILSDDLMIGVGPMPNKPDAANPAMTLWLTNKDQWRRVADLERSPGLVAEVVG